MFVLDQMKSFVLPKMKFFISTLQVHLKCLKKNHLLGVTWKLFLTGKQYSHSYPQITKPW